MHIFHQNVRSLFSNKSLVVEIMETFKNFQILSLTETHISHNVEYGEIFEIQGYEFISQPRKTGPKGGVAAYIQKGLNWDRRKDLEIDEIECLWLEICPPKSKSFLLLIQQKKGCLKRTMKKYMVGYLALWGTPTWFKWFDARA